MLDRVFLAAVMAASLSACSATVPVVDTDGIDQAQFQQDYARCQEFQKQAKAQWQSGAMGGALVGGLLGAIDGDAGAGALAGGVIGTAESQGDYADRKDRIIRECLRQRGYKVLD